MTFILSGLAKYCLDRDQAEVITLVICDVAKPSEERLRHVTKIRIRSGIQCMTIQLANQLKSKSVENDRYPMWAAKPGAEVALYFQTFRRM